MRTWVREGWPLKVAEDVRSYKIRSQELSVEADCVVWGIMVVIPLACRTLILTDLHHPHSETAIVEGLARFMFWWPSVTEEVEQLIRKCEICRINRPNPPSAPLLPRQCPKTMVKSTHGLCRTVVSVDVSSKSGCTLEVD